MMPLAPEAVGVRERRLGGYVVQELESCHSLWLFDVEGRRYLRVPKGASLEISAVEKFWRPYRDVALRPNGSFVITVTPDGSRMVRAWRHLDPCPLCAMEHTAEIPALERDPT